jgi:hypothetical protein
VGLWGTLSAVLGAVLLAAVWVSPAGAAGEPREDDWSRPAAVARRLVTTPVYRTQRDGSRFAGSNCGPAVLGMIFDAYGFSYSNLDLRELSHTYQGTWPNRGGTALQHLAQVADDHAVPVHGLYEGADFHRWSIDDVGAEVARGRWVIPLVRYNLLPGHESTSVRTGHYILLYAIDGAGFTYHDPAYDPVSEGAGRWISRAQLDRAMDPVLVPRQAMALGN